MTAKLGFFLPFLAALPLTSATSYVGINGATSQLIRVSTDGVSGTPIAFAVQGYDVAQEANGNYVVAELNKVQRVTPQGIVTTIAQAPTGSQWFGIVVEANGNLIL